MEYSIGIDIGGTKIAAGIVSKSGEVVYRENASTPQTTKHHVMDVLKRLIQSCHIFKEKHGVNSLKGIGVGTAGQIDFRRGRVLSGTANIADWNDVALQDEIENYTSLPVWVDNDVNVIALAEKHLGVAIGESDVIFLALGTGVGGGVITEGRLVHGAWGSAAELGHISVDMNGPNCNCGFRGCLEAYASGTGIARMMREQLSASGFKDHPAFTLFQQDPTLITSQLVFKWMMEGNILAEKVVREMIRALSFGIVSLIHAYNPTMVVLGGGVMQGGEWIRDAVEKQVRTIGLRSMVDPVKIEIAKLGSDAGLIGAAYQPWIYINGM